MVVPLQMLLVPLGLAAAAPDHYPTKQRQEKSKLTRYLAWLTVLSLTSFIFHPDGMIWVVLYWAMRHTHKLFQLTVMLWGWDQSALSLTIAGLTWMVAVGGAVATGRLYYVHIHPQRDTAAVARSRTPRAGVAKASKKAKQQQHRAPTKKGRSSDQYFASLLRSPSAPLPSDLPPLDVISPSSPLRTSSSTLPRPLTPSPTLVLPASSPVHVVQRKRRPPLTPPPVVPLPPLLSTILPISTAHSPREPSPVVDITDLTIPAAPILAASSVPALERFPALALDEPLAPALESVSVEMASVPLLAPSPATHSVPLLAPSPAPHSVPLLAPSPAPHSGTSIADARTSPGAAGLDDSSNDLTHDVPDPLLPPVDRNDPNNSLDAGTTRRSRELADAMPEASNQDEVDGPRGVMSKSDLMAFLRDPTVTASSIRTHVATGRIDAIAVLAISHRELVDAKVPPLAVRMLFISAMAATQPTPSKAPPSILPPPGFSALSIAATDTHPLKHDSHVRATSPQRSPVIPSKPGAATALFPRAGHHRPDQHVPDNQYEREMERISNQMTRNVLD